MLWRPEWNVLFQYGAKILRLRASRSAQDDSGGEHCAPLRMTGLGRLVSIMYYVYILTNNSHHSLYIGVTNNLERRLYEHKAELPDGFTKQYHLHKLVYYEAVGAVNAAIAREKQLKGWIRKKKML